MRALPEHSWEAISIQARRHQFYRPDRNPYEVDRRYFAQIDTPAKAYDLGLLAADGTITDDGSVRLWLQKRDKQLVMSVRDRIAPGMPINERRNACGIQIYSKEMTNDLIQMGIVPRKSLILDWPQKLPNELVIFFLLGYFDGDGCLTRSTTRGNTYVAWMLLGTLSFLFVAHGHIQDFANVAISEPRPADKRSPQLYALRAAGHKAIIIDRILNASGMGLPRKHLAFET